MMYGVLCTFRNWNHKQTVIDGGGIYVCFLSSAGTVDTVQDSINSTPSVQQ